MYDIRSFDPVALLQIQWGGLCLYVIVRKCVCLCMSVFARLLLRCAFVHAHTHMDVILYVLCTVTLPCPNWCTHFMHTHSLCDRKSQMKHVLFEICSDVFFSLFRHFTYHLQAHTRLNGPIMDKVDIATFINRHYF